MTRCISWNLIMVVDVSKMQTILKQNVHRKKCPFVLFTNIAFYSPVSNEWIQNLWIEGNVSWDTYEREKNRSNNVLEIVPLNEFGMCARVGNISISQFILWKKAAQIEFCIVPIGTTTTTKTVLSNNYKRFESIGRLQKYSAIT